VKRFRPRTLVFDMDGLLVDSEPLWHEIEKDFIAVRGGQWTHELAMQCTGMGIGPAIVLMGQTCAFAVDVERDVAEMEDRFCARVTEAKLKPGARRFLEEAQGRLPIGLASSSTRKIIDTVLAHFKVREHFRITVSGQEVPRAKPFPDVYLKAAELLGMQPADCLALEDSRNGCKAARAAGLEVIAVPEHSAEDFAVLADAVVASLDEARERIDLP
jgi:mannitol-1-/sugar-/sorbitol-6-/2-deoxyglucose-6-phosphatase